ncbi:MAG TPA: alanine racemase [Candidatus Acidoferrum sp.]|nr:alanine racemase [Candidatus Acidoferrum sp.]
MIAELTIDLGAIARNAAALAQLVAPARLCPVVKANAYGHGLVPVARALEPQAARLCVYALEEAVALRDAGIRAPIHVLGPVPANELELAHANDVEITLWDRDVYARHAMSIARRRSAPLRIHAKIDTGVVRLGVPCSEAPVVLARYAGTPEFAITSAFSHLAAAEELDSTFTHQQLARFLAATAGVNGVERHIAATAAAMLWPETRLDAVRPGIGIYGIWPSSETESLLRAQGVTLEPALAWRTRIVVVHEIEAGTTVGYGRTWTTQRRSRIATLPIGYAEGLPRNAGNSAHALVRGTRVPLVGRVCMNMAFLDVTDLPEVAPGDTVTLIGRDGSASIRAEELAAACETIGYEIVARLPAHVPRTYLES